MREEDKFRLIQQRAYELYRQRDPLHGTAEEDWHKAEIEIEREEQRSSLHTGPAKLKERAHWGAIGTHGGEDIENPA
jgi:hypothetical protein